MFPLGNIGTERSVEGETVEGEVVEGGGGCVFCWAEVVVSVLWLSWIPQLVSWERGGVSGLSLLSW